MNFVNPQQGVFMERSKLFILTLAAIVGLGLTFGCNKDDNKDSKDEKASAEAVKKDEDQDKKTAEPGSDKPPLEATGPVAIVDGTEIGADRFNEVVQQRAGAMGGQMPPRLAKMMKKRTVDRLIDEHLIDQKLADEKVTIGPEDVTKEFEKFKERFPDEAAFKTFLKRNGLTADKMKANLKKDLQLRSLLEDKYGIEVTKKDAKDYYDKNTKRFEQAEQVSARHVLIKTEKGADEAAIAKAKTKAEEIAKEAKKADTDFAKLAKEKSEGPSAARGGDLGYFEREKMVPAFSKVAFEMKAGEISDPVKSQFGFHVIKVEGKKEAGTVPYEEAEEKILEQLKRKKFRGAMKKFLVELKKDVKIERKEDNIQVNVQAPKPGQGGHPMMGGGGKGGMQQLPPALKKKLMKQAKERQQEQQQGGEKAKDPTELKLDKPKSLDK
jgi:peptidyl-prolyl cis-trans isomerase C